MPFAYEFCNRTQFSVKGLPLGRDQIVPAVQDHRRRGHCDQHGRTFGAVNERDSSIGIEVHDSINPVDSDPAGGYEYHFLVLTVTTFARLTRTSSQMSSLAGSHPSIPQVSGSNPEGRTRVAETIRNRLRNFPFSSVGRRKHSVRERARSRSLLTIGRQRSAVPSC